MRYVAILAVLLCWVLLIAPSGSRVSRAPDLPAKVKVMLASRGVREEHAAWHLARDTMKLQRSQILKLRQTGWVPTRQLGKPGSGIDFLAMHRHMIEMVNEELAAVGDSHYRRVIGWSQIPWKHDDPDWPMPLLSSFKGLTQKEWRLLERQKDPDRTKQWRDSVRLKYDNDAWLREVSLDKLGIEIEKEWGIHNWFHTHWADSAGYAASKGPNPDDPKNDYLPDPYSSHVNKVFWKFHGWIDDRITRWEKANNSKADSLLKKGWLGPGHSISSISQHRMNLVHAGENLSDTTRIFSDDLRSVSRTWFLQTDSAR